MKRLLTVIFLSLGFLSLSAQTISVSPYLEYGYNKTYGNFFSLAAISEVKLSEPWSLSGGLLLSTANNYSADASLRYAFPLSKDNGFYLENRYSWRLYGDSRTNDFSIVLGAGYKNIHWNFMGGYLAKFFGGDGSYMAEPLGLVFLLEGHLFEKEHSWNIGGRISNAELFLIERYNMLSFSILGDYRLSNSLSLFGLFTVRPTGVFNISAQFYGLSTQVGVRWLW